MIHSTIIGYTGKIDLSGAHLKVFFTLKKVFLFRQDALGMFNEENPSGQVTSADSLQALIIIATVGELP